MAENRAPNQVVDGLAELKKIEREERRQKREASLAPRQSPKLASIIGLLSIIVFFFINSDDFFGAYGLVGYYTPVGGAAILLFIVSGLWYIGIPGWLWIIFLGVAAFGVFTGTGLVGMVLAGWILGIILYVVPDFVILVPLLIFFGFAVRFYYRPSTDPQNALRPSAIFICLVMAIYCLSEIFLPAHFEMNKVGSAQFQGQHYVLNVYWGWLGDPDTLILYECNALGLFCQTVYSEQASSFEADLRKSVLEINSATGNLIVMLDNHARYTYEPSGR